MSFFTYRQNNTGGTFDRTEEVDINVIIEAPNARTANVLATMHGIYFDGVYSGEDCSCCGDRWSDISEDATGHDEPFAYVGSESAICHYLDGRVERKKES